MARWLYPMSYSQEDICHWYHLAPGDFSPAATLGPVGDLRGARLGSSADGEQRGPLERRLRAAPRRFDPRKKQFDPEENWILTIRNKDVATETGDLTGNGVWNRHGDLSSTY